MMGYVVHRTYVTIRPRVFLKARRQAQGYAGAATYAFGYDSDGKFTFFFNDGEG